MALLDYRNELAAWIPCLPVALADKIINRAWRDIRDERPWTFLLREYAIAVPLGISAGTVAVTQYSNQVTGDATASASWAGLANPVVTLRQFRLTNGPLYNIAAADFTNPVAVILTLERIYQEATNPVAASYMIYQCYFPAPDSNFKRWVDVVDPMAGYRFTERNLFRIKPDIDRVDPFRATFGNPYWLASYKLGSVGAETNVPFFEIWPHMSDNRSLLTMYQTKGIDLASDTESIPPQVPEDVLNYRARYHAYEWAEANKGTYAELRATDWISLRRLVGVDYRHECDMAMKNDEETFLQLLIERSEVSHEGIWDSAFLQSHASPWG